jgi:hypothetical protein
VGRAVVVVVEHREHLALPANQVGSPCEVFSTASGSARQIARSFGDRVLAAARPRLGFLLFLRGADRAIERPASRRNRL